MFWVPRPDSRRSHAAGANYKVYHVDPAACNEAGTRRLNESARAEDLEEAMGVRRTVLSVARRILHALRRVARRLAAPGAGPRVVSG